MPSGKTVKLILYELLQFAALSVPVFVIMERFARLMRDVKQGNLTAYWLVVAASVAYVTSVTLLVWVPLKYVILKKRRFVTEITQWRPTALAYLILCPLPCFAILIASSKVQVDGKDRFDHFTELQVSLVLVSLICVDIIERIRTCSLIGQTDPLDSDFEMPSPILTHVEHVTTVSGQPRPDKGQNGLTPGPAEARKDSASQDQTARDYTSTPSRPTLGWQTTTAAYLYSSSSRPRAYSGPLRFLWARDGRAEIFVDSFLFWLDTAELLRVAGEPRVFYSIWVFPIYILAFLSAVRMIITPQNPLLSTAGVVLQDFPFLVFRVALIAVFGFITPLLYVFKNALVSLTFIYFTYLTKLNILQRRSLF
ncbi:transmembrane protein 236 [Genypterus blacodes]|uniref:transmembrane protein 236 n=1 Tax=Genypterus blacodes TaxID=154954 RepID=UPI003F7702F2